MRNRITIQTATDKSLRDRLENLLDGSAEEHFNGEIESIEEEMDCRDEDAIEPRDYDQQDRNAYESERIENHRRER